MELFKRWRLFAWSVALGGIIAASAAIGAESPSEKPVARFTATTTGVASPGQTVTIDLFRWSSDSDRDRFVKAWDIPVPASSPAAPPAVSPVDARMAALVNSSCSGCHGMDRVDQKRADKSAWTVTVARMLQHGASLGDTQVTEVVDYLAKTHGPDTNAASAGRGREEPSTPGRSLLQALQQSTTVGLLWDSEAAGYFIRYAYRLPQPDGGERILLLTDRRLNPWSPAWKPAAPSKTSTDYEFSLIELRVNAQGSGNGKASLDSRIAIDTGAKSIALDKYDSLPVVLTNVRRLKN
jgi:hypothetical protein